MHGSASAHEAAGKRPPKRAFHDRCSEVCHAYASVIIPGGGAGSAPLRRRPGPEEQTVEQVAGKRFALGGQGEMNGVSVKMEPRAGTGQSAGSSARESCTSRLAAA